MTSMPRRRASSRIFFELAIAVSNCSRSWNWSLMPPLRASQSFTYSMRISALLLEPELALSVMMRLLGWIMGRRGITLADQAATRAPCWRR